MTTVLTTGNGAIKSPYKRKFQPEKKRVQLKNTDL